MLAMAFNEFHEVRNEVIKGTVSDLVLAVSLHRD